MAEYQTNPARSTPNLLTDALSHISSLMRKEVDLARSEVNQNISRAVTAIGLIVGAVVIALTALNVLAAALVAALVELGIDDGWSALIVGALFAVIAFMLVSKGVKDLKLSSIAPTRAADNVQRDVATIREKTNV